MARIQPDGWRELRATGAAAREIETLGLFATGLSDAYTVYHNVHWTRVESTGPLFGTVDFAIVNRAGDVLLVEQHPGLLEETSSGLVKRHASGEKRIATRLAQSREAFLQRLARVAVEAQPRVDILLYCPDHAVKSPGSAGIVPERIVDAGRRGRLCDVVRTLLPEDSATTPGAERIKRFLADELRLVPDAGVLISDSRVLYTRLSGGLAHWARCIECAPFRLRVLGTAGSGKTQLALGVMTDAIGAGRRLLYVCYNRPLADHIARIAPAGCDVFTYHQLCDRLYRAAGHVPDFTRADAFATLEAFMADFAPAPAAQYEELVVDEGQDFAPAWKDNLLRMLRPEGRAWWLEDPSQNLYGRTAVPLPGWVTLRADTNYRSPKDIVALLGRMTDLELESGSPIAESGIEILVYDSDESLMERTKTAITRGLGAGIRKADIALLTFRGRDHSRFATLDRLGPHALKSFTGTYDMLGAPVYTPGDLLVESVYRFKGQSAPCAILTEIDFETLDDAARRKLFVGMTRATLKLILVMSARTRAVLGTRIDL